jgi:hypothetical protein
MEGLAYAGLSHGRIALESPDEDFFRLKLRWIESKNIDTYVFTYPAGTVGDQGATSDLTKSLRYVGGGDLSRRDPLQEGTYVSVLALARTPETPYRGG